LNYKDFAFIQCIIPPLFVVEEFNAIYDHLLVIQKHTDEESDRLASLRDTLLPRLMSGELSVDGLKGQFAVSPGRCPG
jgi:type I restriction enzyme S subunit